MDISARSRTTGWRRARPGKSPAPMKPAWFLSMAAIEHGLDRKGGYNPMWMDWKVLIGVPMTCS